VDKKTPTKILRYVLGNVIDLVEPVSGKLFSAADSLLVEKIFKGWRPSHFVDNKQNLLWIQIEENKILTIRSRITRHVIYQPFT
jgi:hypothetical protein